VDPPVDRTGAGKRDDSATTVVTATQPAPAQPFPKPYGGSHSAEILTQAIQGEYRYAMLGLVLGLASIIGGVVLGIHGVVGATSWTASFLGLTSKINDAAPGVVLFIVGLFMIVATRPKVKLGDLRG